MQNNRTPGIYFYIKNHEKIPKEIMLDSEHFHDTRPYGVTDGENAWMLKTWQYLKDAGFSCKLINHIPEEGILFYTYENFEYNQKPTDKTILVYVKGDKPPHPYANLTLVQSIHEQSDIKDSICLPLWPQPGLKTRSVERGNAFENIAYIGTHGSLAKELQTPEWQAKLNSIGLNWIIRSQPDEWDLYSDIDAVLAVRSFSEVKQTFTKNQGKWKPATKLYNSWLAGVIPILGNEPAFKSLKNNELDYLEVNSLNETFETLLRLKEDPILRSKIIANGIHRSSQFRIEAMLQKWLDFIEEEAIPAYEFWCRQSSFGRSRYHFKKFTAMKLYHYKKYFLVKD